MLYESGNYYEGMFSIAFGDVVTRVLDGKSYGDFETVADTWETWHLIPSTRHDIVTPSPSQKFIEVPGSYEIIDMSHYLTGRLQFGWRQGTLNFYVDPGHEHWVSIKEKMIHVLHGKKLKMRLSEDPGYYYEGYFTIGNWDTQESASQISINYQLKPYKMRINPEGSCPVIWDPFNFDMDMDYNADFGFGSLTLNNETKSLDLYSNEYPLEPTVNWISGAATQIQFQGETVTVQSESAEATLPSAIPGKNTMVVSSEGNSVIYISWRGGSL